MLDNTEDSFTITDLKQYIFCPRILYYHTCLRDIRPVTYKMEAGISAHERERQRAGRRSFAQYRAVQGKRYYDVPVHSKELGLSGQIDEVVDTGAELFPVDYKQAQSAGFHFKVQLTAYALLLEETTHRPVQRGFLYLIPKRNTIEVAFTTALRRKARQTLEAMRRISTTEHLPAPTDYRQRCLDCEFRRFCNDVV